MRPVAETVSTEARYGGQTMWAPLRRVLVRAPEPAAAAAWRAFGWHREPDAERIAAEHEAFRGLLAEAGVEVVIGQTSVPLSPDAVYTYDPAIVTDRGAILLRPGKEGRRVEVDAMEADLLEAGVPILGRLEAPALAEGGDTVWLDERTLLVGIGYRTNETGVEVLRRLLPDVEVLAFDLPYLNGPGTANATPLTAAGATLHVADAGRALVAALDVPSGIYNVCRDDERVSNTRFKRASGWRPAL